MTKLSKKQMAFLKKEFCIEELDYADKAYLNEIREKCFDIETEETYDRLNDGIDESSIGERGDMAVTIIDDLEEIIKDAT